jgi:beta-glucanase (GH16 family)
MKQLLLALSIFLCTYASAYNVTFRLNMNGLSGFTRPEVNGTFNGWCGNCNAMTDSNADGIWETTISLNAGSYEYKFSFDSWTGEEDLSAAGSCAITSGTFSNRTLVVQSDMVLNVACWGLCNDCLPENADTWSMVWSDEFDGSALNEQVWSYNIGTGVGGWGNNELQYYTNNPNNIEVSNGSLKITARQENFNGSTYTSSRIITNNLMEFKYGKIESRIKVPIGQGLWPAFWMLGANFETVSWPQCGEIDIMEHINNESVTNGTVHWKNNSGHSYKGSAVPFDENDFHVYAAIWDSTSVTFELDGHSYFRFPFIESNNTEAIFRKEFFLLLNVAVGGNWPGYPDGSATFPASMEVDYIRIFNNDVTSNSTDIEIPSTNIYPNPFDDQLTISNLLDGTTWDVRITNCLGQIVAQQKVTSSSSAIDTKNWNAGVYFVTLVSKENKQINLKVIKK